MFFMNLVLFGRILSLGEKNGTALDLAHLKLHSSNHLRIVIVVVDNQDVKSHRDV